MAIQTEKCDAISRIHSRIAQSTRETGRAFREFRVSEPLVSANNRGFPGKLLLGIPQKSDGTERDVHDLNSPGSLAAVDDENVPGDIVRCI